MRRVMHIWLASLFLLLAEAGMAQEVKSKAYAVMLNGLLERQDPELGVAELAQRPELRRLDARSAEEYAVSHLQGARRVGFKDFDPARVRDLPRDTPVVVYCSVGYRSEKIAARLRKMGFTEVYNLYGGLFEWVNRGNPVYRNEQATRAVHGYSWTWGIWLRRGKKVYGPPEN
ncbi:MAG: rhodanese-like domain-containing protein [Schleiferiaceae bacterium]|nr:rhodanese-like domain-containing protein [Schleiferiaceae bacterium]